MCSTIYSAANNILLMRNCKHDLWWKMADCSPELSESDLNNNNIWWSNDKTVIELGYRKISCCQLAPDKPLTILLNLVQ